MPIYEFYCPDCHRVMTFLSRKIDPEGRPSCPKCGRKELHRRVSAFAISKGRKEEAAKGPDPADDLGGLDEERMARAMESLAGEAEGMDESDPRQAARFMRKMFSATGMPMNSGVEEAIRRMESGEDPEKVEAEMGDVLESAFGDLPGGGEGGEAKEKGGVKGLARRFTPPTVDPTLYEM